MDTLSFSFLRTMHPSRWPAGHVKTSMFCGGLRSRILLKRSFQALRTRYIAGNIWGECGCCRAQEEFQAYSDISVPDRDCTVDNSLHTTLITMTTSSTSVTEFVDIKKIQDTIEHYKRESTRFSLAIFVISFIQLSLGFILMIHTRYHKTVVEKMAESSYSCMRKSANEGKKTTTA